MLHVKHVQKEREMGSLSQVTQNLLAPSPLPHPHHFCNGHNRRADLWLIPAGHLIQLGTPTQFLTLSISYIFFFFLSGINIQVPQEEK